MGSASEHPAAPEVGGSVLLKEALRRNYRQRSKEKNFSSTLLITSTYFQNERFSPPQDA